MNFNRTHQLAVAISLVLTANVATAFDIDSPTVLTYASELSSDTMLSGAKCDQTITGKIGRDIPKAATATLATTRYLRFELSAGATFSGTINASNFTTAGSGDVNLVSGGSSSNFVVFSITNTDTSASIPKDQTFSFAAGQVTVSGKDTPVQLSYSLHTNDVSAATGTSGDAIEYSKASLSYINFGTGLLFSVSPNKLTADVETGFVTFKSGTTSGSLGTVSLEASDQVCSATGNDLTMSELLGGSATLLFEGDLTLIQDVDDTGEGLGSFGDTTNAADTGTVRLASTSTCDSGIDASSVTEDSATITGIVSEFSDASICVVRPVTSKVKIPADDSYVLTLDPLDGSSITAPTGDIVRDGTVLDAPYFTMTTGYISRFIISNLNPSGNAATFTIELQSDEGNVITPNTAGPLTYDATEGTFAGTLAAGTIMQINATDLVTSFSTKQRGSAKFTFVASNNDIQGIYQVVNLTTGEVSNIPLPREGGGDGQ